MRRIVQVLVHELDVRAGVVTPTQAGGAIY